ncbi:MAG: flagellar basal body P-ring formation chaperone FlgA [Tropicimonas sp.]|uniref:flagellar basal body P-ring formation chaperone FlgA n=1 Tax=Tropicimonas sp. TaxID=2067044 RepID=UPI003A852BAC
MKTLLLLLALLVPATALADTVVAARTMRAGTVLTGADLATVADDVPGAISSLDDVLGMEARVNLYAGRPIRAGEVGPPALVERNEIVTLIYDQSGLSIATEGRVLDRGGLGDRIRVMNLSSRTTVTGTVREDGRVYVANPDLTFASR